MVQKDRKQLIANKLRSLREQADISQKEMAEIIGCAASTISGYEIGNRLPDIPTLEKYSIHFKIPLIDLLFLSDETSIITNPELPPDLQNLGVEEISLIRDLRTSGLDPTEVKALLDLIRVIKK